MKKVTDAVAGRFGRRRERWLRIENWVLSRSTGVGLGVWHGVGLGKVMERLAGEGEQGQGFISEAPGGRQESEQRFSSGGNSAFLPQGTTGGIFVGIFGCHNLRGVGRAAPALKQVEARDSAKHTTAYN